MRQRGAQKRQANDHVRQWSASDQERAPIRLLITAILIIAAALSIVIIPKIASKALFLLATIVILTMAALRITLSFIAILSAARPNTEEPPHADWPSFTVLVPLYKEAHVVPALCSHLRALDYPKRKLRIILVTEADDRPSCAAAHAAAGGIISVFETPPSQPRTKPKALNAALFAMQPERRGDIVTIYDAEDRPDPGQLREAALALTADPMLGAVQAPLDFVNERDSPLAALFTLEYAALFHVFNPGLTQLGLPFSLGGTSNHIRRAALEAIGGWDAYNVTEDADLGFKLAACGYRLGCITRPTREEALSTRVTWQRQRRRWMKGFMQTLCVHVRRHHSAPDGGPKRTMGIRTASAIAMAVTLAMTLIAAFLHVPSLLVFGGAGALDLGGVISIDWPPAFFTAMAIGIGAAMLQGAAGALKCGKPHLLWYVPLMPLYWLLHFWPACRALAEYFSNPFYWDKTAHFGHAQKAPPNSGLELANSIASPSNDNLVGGSNAPLVKADN